MSDLDKSVDQELKSFLEGMESRITSDIKSRLEMRLGEIEARRKSDDAAVEIRMKEHVEATGTRLLTDFWMWAGTSEIKSRANTENIALELRGRI